MVSNCHTYARAARGAYLAKYMQEKSASKLPARCELAIRLRTLARELGPSPASRVFSQCKPAPRGVFSAKHCCRLSC